MQQTQDTSPKRACDCWIGEAAGPFNCFCPLGEGQSTRYSVQRDGVIHGRFETVKGCIEYGREELTPPFSVYDHLEERLLIKYEV